MDLDQTSIESLAQSQPPTGQPVSIARYESRLTARLRRNDFVSAATCSVDHAATRDVSTNDQQPSSQYGSVSSDSSPSRGKTQRLSAYPPGDFRNNALAKIVDMKIEMMCNWLFQQQLEKMWSSGRDDEGVILKKSRGDYIACPKDLQAKENGIAEAVSKMNVRCAMTMNTQVVALFVQRDDSTYVPLENGLRVQILPDFSYLPRCQKHHFAAFIQEPPVLIVWDDDPNHLLQRAQDLEDKLMNMTWRENDREIAEKEQTACVSTTASRAPGMHLDTAADIPEFPDESFKLPKRRAVLIQPILTATTLAILIAAIGGGWRQIAIEIKVDKSWLRLAFAVVVPLQCWLALFFMQSVAGCIAQMVGPISQMKSNTKFFSVQCPVYKEGLWSVIDPTVKSIKAAISTYEMQGGTANIFINDDGMQVISRIDARERREYYDEHNIGWVARPKHNPKPADGEKAFVRAGKFKKASNMNYALNVSARVEEELSRVGRTVPWNQELETEVCDSALAQVIAEDEGRTQAEGNLRVGDYILLIDSDTRVPADCFLDAVSEMELSPEVAIIQFSSGVMNVTTSWFEKGVTFFTNLVYTAIQYAVSNGDVAPFVGHNAFLRWSAVQDVAYIDTDQTEKYWSESTVSEDFDMALRLQTSGYILRLAAYAGQGFKEGVSLSVYDELARWEKYAYGCSELIFHPFARWLSKGPFTPLFRKFICSTMPLPSKLTIMAYIGTYYAIASAWILTLLNYCIIGWFNGHLDHYYIDSFKIYFAIVIVFTALGNVALAVLRYRVEERSLGAAILENFAWVALLTVFLGGISLHVSQAILCHMCGVDMTWGATSKEAINTSFFAEIPVILHKFRFTFIWTIGMTGSMIVIAGVGPLGHLVPHDWQIRFFTAVWPLATVVASHFWLPLVLNPGLMQFTF